MTETRTTMLERLERGIPKLSEGDQQFAWALLRTARNPRLTETQWERVQEFLTKINLATGDCK